MNDDDWDFDAVCAEQDALLDELAPDLQFGSGVFDGPSISVMLYSMHVCFL